MIITDDFTSDKKPNLAVNSNDSRINILMSNRSGIFLPVQSHSFENARSMALVAANFNMDTKIDLAAIYRSSSNVSLLLGNRNGTFRYEVSIALDT